MNWNINNILDLAAETTKTEPSPAAFFPAAAAKYLSVKVSLCCNLNTRKPVTQVPIIIPDGYPGTKIPKSPSTKCEQMSKQHHRHQWVWNLQTRNCNGWRIWSLMTAMEIDGSMDSSKDDASCNKWQLTYLGPTVLCSGKTKRCQL